jgi:RNA polymerase-binding protein DksA
MNRSTTPSYLRQLKAEREQTIQRLAHLRAALRSELDPDFDEADPDLAERENTIALVYSLERKLASIDYALQQVQRGAYGICEGCGKPIDPARLAVVPETTLCLKCKMITERLPEVYQRRMNKPKQV